MFKIYQFSQVTFHFCTLIISDFVVILAFKKVSALTQNMNV